MPHAELPVRPAAQHSTTQPLSIPIRAKQNDERRHKHSRSSYSDAGSLLNSRNNSLTFHRPAKRPSPTPNKTIAIINAGGRQAASVIRVATAVGYHVRAQMRNMEGIIAEEIASNPSVTLFQGELYTRHGPKSEGADLTQDGPISGIGINHSLISELFRGAQLAFINTTFYGNEVEIGQVLADEAKKAGVQHYVYSSMPDHHTYDKSWPSLPLWASKHKVEEYVRKIGLPATFVYTGIYNNNFTSLVYPLFCMDLQEDGSFVWQAPFHPDAKLPWLDAEHDVGPAILQVFKDGISKWGGKRIALAWEMLSPREACEQFANGVGRKVTYVRGEIEIKVRIPDGYRVQLEALEKLFLLGGDDPAKQPPYFGDRALEDDCPHTAMQLWEGPRGLEEYARETFPLEESANGKTWMDNAALGLSYHHGEEDFVLVGSPNRGVGGGGLGGIGGQDEYDSEDEEEDGLVMRVAARGDQEWLA
ncbi:NmrA-like family-domain-containing protein [Coniella lustricola]|uniref:NmrA-like family-domain-containing protein n=1 Tax=Coniella lustricola TaxID=2025994 RepID=A0A2T2ZZI6_9PEZI|nr:NmrA-like family-domain-containing protein [Coniella lustricola]